MHERYLRQKVKLSCVLQIHGWYIGEISIADVEEFGETARLHNHFSLNVYDCVEWEPAFTASAAV
jgi:hypothetical protein